MNRDDNISLGRIEGQVLAALEEGRRRIQGRPIPDNEVLEADELFNVVPSETRDPKQHPRAEAPSRERFFSLKS